MVSKLTTLSETVFKIKHQVDSMLKRPNLVYEDLDYSLSVTLPVNSQAALSQLNDEIVRDANARETLVILDEFYLYCLACNDIFNLFLV